MTVKKQHLVLILAALAALALFGFLKEKRSSSRGQYIRKVMVEQGRISEAVETTGEVTPLNRVEIQPPISGRIEELLVDEGDTVKKGQILAWMSSADRAAILDAARAKGPEELKRWEDTYKPTPIIAPLSGVIILRNVVVGQTVGSSAVLYAMADKLIVLARVDETDIGRVRVGQEARISLDAYPDSAIEGKVFNILYEGKNVSNVITYGVKVEPKAVPAFFRSQMTANVRLIMNSKEDALLVPLAAVNEERPGQKLVFVPGADGKPEPREVETGTESGDNVEILSGLSAGDAVLIVRKRYTPQRETSSPLVGGGRQGGRGRRPQ